MDLASSQPEDAQSSPSADPRVRQVATVYAKAFLAAAESAGKAAELLDEFSSLLTDVLDRFPRWGEVLSSGLLSPEEKIATLDRALSAKASPLLMNFLWVLARHSRLDCLRPAYAIARELHEKSQGRVNIQVHTATPLSSELAAHLTKALRGLVGSEPRLIPFTDPDLIGGVVLRIGDTVYDGSVSSQLEGMRTAMINRSVHEIQSRRDSFRHPDGN